MIRPGSKEAKTSLSSCDLERVNPAAVADADTVSVTVPLGAGTDSGVGNEDGVLGPLRAAASWDDLDAETEAGPFECPFVHAIG